MLEPYLAAGGYAVSGTERAERGAIVTPSADRHGGDAPGELLPAGAVEEVPTPSWVSGVVGRAAKV